MFDYCVSKRIACGGCVECQGVTIASDAVTRIAAPISASTYSPPEASYITQLVGGIVLATIALTAAFRHHARPLLGKYNRASQMELIAAATPKSDARAVRPRRTDDDSSSSLTIPPLSVEPKSIHVSSDPHTAELVEGLD